MVFLCFLFIFVARLLPSAEGGGSSSISCHPNSRFTVVTPRIIRIEYINDLSSNQFEDRSSTAFAHRISVLKDDVRVENRTSEWCNISVKVPPYLELSFRKKQLQVVHRDRDDDEGTAYFKSHDLSIIMSNELSSFVWKVGMKATGNLLGTIGVTNNKLAGANTSGVDLSGCCANLNYPYEFDPAFPLQEGLLSRDGWSVVDDSFTQLIDHGTGDFDHGWVSDIGRQRDSKDWFFFGCGLDYGKCLEEFVQVSGKISVPTKNALGVWWSRHWGDSYDHDPFGPMTDDAIMRDVVNGYLIRKLPLDVVVLDMEWHSQVKYPQCETFIGYKGWGGYTFNKTLFPDPQKFIEQLHFFGVDVALNFHPDGIIDACQDPYGQLAELLGIDPATKVDLPDLDVSQTNKTYCDAYFSTCIDPLNSDVSWTDTANSTTWSNYLYVRYPALRKNKRTINFSRYTGIGDQRKPIGFSGDTLRKYETLQYEVWMTPRAGNVGFGWWSHDIGGFKAGSAFKIYFNHNHTETPELFLRWLQFAAFAPIFRQHCRFCDQRIWTFGDEWYNLMKHTLLERHRLFPYINTHAHLETYAKGRSLLVPLYWSSKFAASMDEAYAPVYSNTEYLFGKHFLVAPITQPLNETRAKLIWLPPGEWVSWRNTTQTYRGPTEILLEKLKLNDSPVFVNTSSIIPLRADFDSKRFVGSNTSTGKNILIIDPVVWVLFPFSTTSFSSGELFEDDGSTMDYRRKDSSGVLTQVTAFKSTVAPANRGSGPLSGMKITVRVESQIGTGLSNETRMKLPTHRNHWFKMAGTVKSVRNVECADQVLDEIDPAGSNNSIKNRGYWKDDVDHSLVINCGRRPLLFADKFDIVVHF